MRAKDCSARSFLSSGPLRHPLSSRVVHLAQSTHTSAAYKPHRGPLDNTVPLLAFAGAFVAKARAVYGWLRRMPHMRLFACFAQVSKYRFLLPTLPRREIELLSYDTMMIFTKQTRVSERSR